MEVSNQEQLSALNLLEVESNLIDVYHGGNMVIYFEMVICFILHIATAVSLAVGPSGVAGESVRFRDLNGSEVREESPGCC